ncbi:MAG: carbon-nitrogen hydrolase family protein [Acidobacteriota bacterium]
MRASMLFSAPLLFSASLLGNGWEPVSQRTELMPKFSTDRTSGDLMIKGNGDFRANGAWRRSFPVQEKTYYRVRARYRASDIELPRRSVLVQVDWKDAEGSRVGYPDYPATLETGTDGWTRVESGYMSPAGAASATVDLTFRWDDNGSVRWAEKDISLEAAEPPAPRHITIATINHRPQRSSGPLQNLKEFGELVAQAGKQGADIVCLPEGVTVVGTGKSYLDVAEPVPGPTTEFLGKIAREHELYIVAGLYEKVEETLYNTAVLIDREGNVAGSYRKVSLPREEIEGGITPGQDFPVFQTDFGRVGMMICWDLHFSEPARRLAASGAEIIFLPIWGGNELLFPARAIENQVHLVSSSYDAPTAIWDRTGKMVSNAPEKGDIAVYKVNLEERTSWEWLGDFRDRIPREAPPVR